PLGRLTVDEPALRAAAGYASPLSAEAIEGTRQNMLNKVLEAEQFPFALIQVRRSNSNTDILQVAITLHGKQQTFETPAMIETLADGLKISGELQFRQSDFGITPFSILGGALQVQDQVHLRFSIVAGEKY
ncbi:MAG TPA: YceI family protein, partial [Pseudomonadales bacterium]